MSESDWTFETLIDTLISQAKKQGPKACEACIFREPCMDLKADFTCDGFVELLGVLGLKAQRRGIEQD